MAEAHREAKVETAMIRNVAHPVGPLIPVRKDERTEAIRENTRALLELAQAIREHAYLTAPEEDEDDEPRTYMDGTPVQ